MKWAIYGLGWQPMEWIRYRSANFLNNFLLNKDFNIFMYHQIMRISQYFIFLCFDTVGPQKILQLFHLLLDRSPAFEIKWKIWQNFITVGHVNWKYKPIIFCAEILCILWHYHNTWCSSGAFHQLAQKHQVTFWTACATVLQSKPKSVACRTVSRQRESIYNWIVQELLSAWSLFPRSSKKFELFLWASFP